MLTVQAASITLAWDPPNPSTEIAGYNLHFGTVDRCDSEDLPDGKMEVIDVGNATQHTMEGLEACTSYAFAVQAYTADGRTSDFSNKVCHAVATDPRSRFLRVLTVDSQETGDREKAEGEKTLDCDPTTFWHSRWDVKREERPPLPHHIIFDLGAERKVVGIRYLPRQDGNVNGTIGRYEVYMSRDLDKWDSKPLTSGLWEWDVKDGRLINKGWKDATFGPARGRYLKLVAKSEANGNPSFTSAGEIEVRVNLE
jgi:hypothetical protein